MSDSRNKKSVGMLIMILALVLVAVILVVVIIASSGSSETIKGEFSANGVENNISHVRGVISMARRGDSMDSGSCQFFIVHEDSDFLNGNYAAFGRVVSGMEIVDGIANTPLTYNLATYELSNPIHQVNLVKAYFVTPDAN